MTLLCPTCSAKIEIGSLDDLPSFPFCSERCRLIDLGRWADGTYLIPGQPEEPAESAEPIDPAGNGQHGD